MSEPTISPTAIKTYSGVWFDALNIDPDLIRLEDIAHALSNLCRYTGHCREFYSVAEHSFWVSTQVPEDYRLAGLMHDASEAYLNDIAKPLKDSPLYVEYRELEEQLQAAIYSKFRIPFLTVPKPVKLADRRLYETEARDLMGSDFTGIRGLDLTDPSDPYGAKTLFLQRYRQLTTY